MLRVSKTRFKARALGYLREVEETHNPVVVTNRGKPVLKVIPYTEDPAEILKDLRGSVVKYKDPTKPVDN